jgi:DNA-binding LacI/PurR family transcriptional regulator
MNSASSIESVPAVLSDNLAGGRLAAEHLLRLGHVELAFIATPPSANLAVDERLEGARSAVREAGLDPASLLVVNGDGGVEGGAQAALEALAAKPQTTALICYNDLTAVGALRGARAVGRSVPQELSIVGFDDIELAPYVDPPLTTVRQDTDAMSTWAVTTLLGLIAVDAAGRGEEPAETPLRRIAVELVERGSTAAARVVAG